jgi:hypothetical protein
MPGIVDKWWINGQRDAGNAANIEAALESGAKLANEISELGLLQDAEPIRQKMIPMCAEFNAAQEKYCAGLNERIGEMDDLINSKVLAPASPPQAP